MRMPRPSPWRERRILSSLHHFFHGDVEMHALEYVFEEFLRFFSSLFLLFRIERGFFSAFFVSRFFFVFLGFCFFRFLGFFSGFSRSFCSFFGSFLGWFFLGFFGFWCFCRCFFGFRCFRSFFCFRFVYGGYVDDGRFLVDQSEKSAGGLFYDMNDCFFTADSQLFYAVFYCGFNCFCCDSDCSHFVSSASPGFLSLFFLSSASGLARELSFSSLFPSFGASAFGATSACSSLSAFSAASGSFFLTTFLMTLLRMTFSSSVLRS